MWTSLIWSFVFLIFPCFIVTSQGSKVTKDAEYRLRKDLLENHNSKTLPSLNDTTPVSIEISLAIRQILDVDEKNQVMVTSIWFRQYWKDNILSWNASKYDGVKQLHLTKKEIWVPDIAIYNTASNYGILYQRLDTQIVLNNDGQVFWLTPIQLKTECKINVKYFPFDEQVCRIIIGSWTYHGFKVDIHARNEHADTSSFVQNTEWDLLDAYFTRSVKVYSCCVEPYPSIAVHVHIRRRSLFYLFNLVIPCGVIALLASISFFLPSNNGERISLVVTVLLSLTVYMLIVSETMPATSEVVPLIGKFYISTMVLIACTLIAVCISLNCYEQDTRMSGWLRQILINIIARVLCVLEKPKPRTNAIGLRVNEAFVLSNNLEKIPKPETKPNQEGNVLTAVSNKDETNQNSEKQQKSSKSFEDIVLQQKIKTQKENKDIQDEWKTASKALDRAFFLVFLVVFVMMSIIVFSEAPYISLT